MTIGTPSEFAIESVIAQAYVRPSFRALGFFVIYINGYCYGVRLPDATMLACSYDAIESRINRQGQHTASFACEPDAGKIADAVRAAIWGKAIKQDTLGYTQGDLRQIVYSKHLVWAPDGDAAFDDGSVVLQFDVEDRVRIIAFKSLQSNRHDPSSLHSTWMKSEHFYGILQQWKDAFTADWKSRCI